MYYIRTHPCRDSRGKKKEKREKEEKQRSREKQENKIQSTRYNIK